MIDFSGKTFVMRVDGSNPGDHPTLAGDLEVLTGHHVRPILVAPTAELARRYVCALNARANVAVGLSGADAAFLPAANPERVGNVDPRILDTLIAAGYIPVIAPTGIDAFGHEIALESSNVATAIAVATEAVRAIFFHDAGGVVDPASSTLISELTPSEAFELAERLDLDNDLRGSVRAAALSVRSGVPAAQIVDGGIAHAAIVELLTAQHLGTQVTGSVFIG